MQNIITGIVGTIIGGIALMVISFVVSIALPKNTIITMLKEKHILRTMRYLLIILLMALCGLLLPLSKMFVFSVCILFTFMILMFVYDYSIARFMGITRAFDEDKRQKDIDTWTNQLAMCDRKDTERINMIKAKLKNLHK